MREPLPIDAVLPEALARLSERGALVLEAPPGAGKTTRLPVALLESGLVPGQVWVLQPRRIAARMAARRVAEELGEAPGQTVGFQVRFEGVSGPRTRLLFMTEGVLTRRLLSDGLPPEVGAVVLDEIHERHLDGDLAGALLRRIRGERPDLKLVAMSATLDAARIATWLSAPRLTSEGRRFEVAIEYEDKPDDRPLEARVSGAVKRLLGKGLSGDLLVFLPGAAEIRRTGEALREVAERQDLLVLPLHGDLPPEEQDRAVRPAPRRRVILSTNVAETSLTIEGVTAVIDSGLARVASLAPWSGIPQLTLARVSQASCIQRAGRAGRLGPGVGVRLFTRHDFETRPPQETPEVLRLDLAETVLALLAKGIDPEGLDWLDPPPAASLSAARELLSRLGAIREGTVTGLGTQMLRFPLHPRLSRLLLEAETRGAWEEGVLAAALLSERDLSRETGEAREHADSDLVARLEAFRESRGDPDRARRLGLDPGGVLRVERARKQLARIGRSGLPPRPKDDALLLATLAAFPDRVARRRGEDLALAAGGAARLARESRVREADLLVALDAEERRGGSARLTVPLVRMASAIRPDWLLDLFPEEVREEEKALWDPRAERVEVTSRLLYQTLVLTESRVPGDPETVAALLRTQALSLGPSAFLPDLGRLLARLAFLGERRPGSRVPGIGEAREALSELCRGRRSFGELREAGLGEALLSRLEPRERQELATLAPERITLPGGRPLRVEWETGKPPWIASRLQDFFGSRAGPQLGGVPVVLHLLGPNQRDLQVTTDLAGFWERHYPSLRRTLMRKYPRHAWPEDPLSAAPPPPRGR